MKFDQILDFFLKLFFFCETKSETISGENECFSKISFVFAETFEGSWRRATSGHRLLEGSRNRRLLIVSRRLLQCKCGSQNVLFSGRCSCKIDCSGHNENPVCGTDGNSYNNPCLVREASCLKQEQIDVKHLGRCPGKLYMIHHLLWRLHLK